MNMNTLTTYRLSCLTIATSLAVGLPGCGDTTFTSESPGRSAASELAAAGDVGKETSITLGGKPKGVRYCRRSDIAQVCSDDEIRVLVDFQSTVCSAEFDKLFGPNHVDGNFAGGACEAYVTCYNVCPCEDGACRKACSPDKTCLDAATELFRCAVGSAQRADSPKCKAD